MDFAANKPSFAGRPNYAEHKDACVDFLLNFEGPDPETGAPQAKYRAMIQEAVDRERRTVDIDVDDLVTYGKLPAEFVKNVEANTMRYVHLFAQAITSDDRMPKADPAKAGAKDVYDVLYDSRERMLRQQQASAADEDLASLGHLPDEIRRRFEVRILPQAMQKVVKVRNVGAAHVGSLLKVQGICTRVTEVRPMMKVAVYVCDVCGNEVYQVVRKKQYTPLQLCPSEECQRNKNRRVLLPQTRGSKFVKFQEIKLQESPEEVPEGHVPRTINVYAVGECTRKCTCGDKVTVCGVWLPIPYTGFKARNAGLTTNTYLHAMTITKEKKGYHVDHQDRDVLDKVDEIAQEPDCYDKLARSIAPEIFGLDDVKKAMLLLLVAGVTKTQADGMKIRGDINVLLMGDPGVAKSQLLKHITTVAPRAVYTTGKGSSGVGLTAAVVRDPVTRDMTLEGGALVLSDMGICCIDEFDKMEEGDRTAIHEVMEQQTISIAKAGITTTLNARTAILAAANPAFGRYDKRRTPEQNINLPAALLSRFDLLFVMVDKPSLDNDIALARHIAYVHQHSRHPDPEAGGEFYDADVLRAFIARAREYEPVIPRELTQYIVSQYVTLRKNSLNEEGQYDSRKIVGTPRALLSILRLGQALARLRFSDEVEEGDITEAIRLIREAKRSSLSEDEMDRDRQDPIAQVYELVVRYLKDRRNQEGRIADLKTMLTTRGFSNAQIESCLDQYEENDVWTISDNRQTIVLVA